ncbi:MAG: FimB/Mfa2 family fimbrial subunit [Muribaculaceae bacterium]|nr:FimB/Mfa2 family fimbrial subunit [Muribaculaceae bacterium]
MRLKRYIIRAASMLMLIIALIPLASCDAVFDDLDPCPTPGVRLRFVYDYNMEFADAFASQVDCLTLLVYDASGKYVTTRTASKAQTSDKNWRMDIDLPAGKYSLLAYGGMECPDSSFSFVSDPAATPEQDIEVALKPGYLSPDVDKPLHHLFYGALDVTVSTPKPGSGHTEATVYMIKDTNDIRILLANTEGIPTDAADFDFSIEDNNTLLNWQNLPISDTSSTYYPWTKGNVEAGIYDNDNKAQMAFAELSTSRLMERGAAQLKVTRLSDGKEVIRIPLVNILLLLKSERYQSMGPQEFLDRQSRWNLTFLLTGSDEWIKTSIIINDWIVRINNIEE